MAGSDQARRRFFAPLPAKQRGSGCSGAVRLVFFLLLLFLPSGAGATEVNEALVKIYTVYNRYHHHNPWQFKGQQVFHGSGCIIEGNRILTSAHVVGDQVYIQVRRGGQAEKYEAKIEIVGHECDLAILTVADEKFFEGANPLPLGALPRVRDQVTVYGFPDGGDRLSLSEGVVSRIEHIEYAHSGAYLLATQIDASINSGNSGGPVLKDGKIVGIAFQGMSNSRYDNIGYMVPAPVIRHFLTDIEDGRHDGTPDLGVVLQKMESPDMRRYFQMGAAQTGALVTRIMPDSPCEGVLEKQDVVTAIEGFNIGNDGTIGLRRGQRTYFGAFAQEKQLGERLRLQVLRDGKPREVEVRLTKPINFDRLIPREQFDVEPRYYIFGGLVFQPLTLSYLKEFGSGEEWASYTPTELLHYYLNVEKTDKEQEVVILAKVLADKSNVGYHDFANRIIESVNGRKIRNLAELVAIISDTESDSIVIKDNHGFKIILDRRAAAAASPAILKRFGIAAAGSAGLRNRE